MASDAPWNEETLRGERGARVLSAMLEAADHAGLGVAISYVEPGDSRLAYANRALLALLGWHQQDLSARRLLSVFAEDELPRVRALHERRQRGEALPPLFETVVVHASGRRIPVQVSTSLVQLDGRNADVTFVSDITQRIATIEQLMQADKLAAVGTLAAGVAHEINNPLAYLLLGLELLTRELPRLVNDPSRLDAALARLTEAKQGAERVKAIVHDLQTFTRNDDGIGGEVDLSLVIERALQMARHELRQRAPIDAQLDPVPRVHGNATRFEQLFFNLVQNAIQALPLRDGRSDHIAVRLRSGPGGSVVASVQDTGVGMSPEVVRRAFEPFYSTKPAGTGLGLAICQGIVRSAGGSIGVDSAPGKGTTVTVVLPACEPQPAARTR